MKIKIITLGGTIAKTYSEETAVLSNSLPVIEEIVASCRTPDLTLSFEHLMHKDSLDMTDDDRALTVECVVKSFNSAEAVIVVQGTDTLSDTGKAIYQNKERLSGPVIITGAMRPHVINGSDATQNIVESLLACRLLCSGVFCVMHNRVLTFPNVEKDYKNLTFSKSST